LCSPLQERADFDTGRAQQRHFCGTRWRRPDCWKTRRCCGHRALQGWFEIVPRRSASRRTSWLVVKVVDKRGSREVARAYIEFLYSRRSGVAAKLLRPRGWARWPRLYAHFPALSLFTSKVSVAGNKRNGAFRDGGFDQISQPTISAAIFLASGAVMR